MKVEIYGVKKVWTALGRMEPEVRKELSKELSAAARATVMLARGYVDPSGLSGWGNWRGGYSPATIAGGIKVKRGGSRKKGQVTSNWIGVINGNAAGAIWEVAGRKTRGKGPGQGKGGRGYGAAMIAAIEDKGGKASRTVWAAMDSDTGEQAKRQMAEAIMRAAQVVQHNINQGG